MTLATRCSACGTSFRVVQDQLKVSGGWVRCGRCGEVFNAIEGLYEVGSPMAEPAPVVVPPAAAPVVAPAPATAPEPSTSAAPAVESARTAESAPLAELPRWPEGSEQLQPAPFAVDEGLQLEAERPVAHKVQAAEPPQATELASTEPEAVSIEPSYAASVAEPVAVTLAPAVGWAADPEAESDTAEPAPSFLLKAERAARWQRPGVKRALGGAMLLLTTTLSLQAAFAYRDTVAARWPAARAPLQQVCSWAGCRIEPPRHIAALSVESSGLRQVGQTPYYELSVVLRNRDTVALKTPALELVLSDAQGATVARKVLTLAQLGRADAAIGANAEWSVQGLVDTAGRRVSGYTIEIFYP